MEEGLRYKGFAGVVGELSRLPLTASRRLQLAAEKSGVTAFAIRRTSAERDEANAAFSRWRIGAEPSAKSGRGLGRARWKLELLRCRRLKQKPGSWRLAMRRVVSLFVRSFPTDCLRRKNKDAPPRDRPMVTAAQDGGRRVVVAVDAAAWACRLRPGMTVTHEQALVPDLHIAEAQPDEDAAALERLALWCTRYSPLVTAQASDNLFIDIAGAAHLFKGETALRKDLQRRLGAVSYAVIAIADTPGCAWAIARYGADMVVPPGRMADVLGSLPVAALRLPAETVQSLRDVGLERVAQVASKPRGPLQTRFGRLLLDRLDQALGTVPKSLPTLIPPEVPRASLKFIEPVGDPEDLQRIIVKLCETLMRDLETRGVGARRLDLIFLRVDNIAQAIRIGTSRPNRDVKHLAKLLGERLVLVDPGFGIEEASLSASWIEALTERQTLGAQVADQGSMAM